MVPKKLIAKNWLSFQEIDYDFKNKPLQIIGQNLTDDSQESNGSGKSSIQSAVEKLLFDTTARKVKDEDLIMYGKEESYLYLELYCGHREESLIIERKIKRKGSNEAQLSIGGVIVHSFEDKVVREINDGIIVWIGIAKEDLQNYFIISKEKFKSFFSSSNSDKLELLNRFSDTSIIDNVDSEVKKEIANKNIEIQQDRDQLNKLKGRLEVYTQKKEEEEQRDLILELEDKKAKFKQELAHFEETILNYEDSIVKITQSIEQESDLILNKKEILSGVQFKLLAFKEKSFDNEFAQLSEEKSKITDKILKKKKEKGEHEQNLDELHDILIDIEKNLKGAVVCPKCSHKFLVGDPSLDLIKEEESKKDVVLAMSQIEGFLSKIKGSISELDSSSKELIQKERELTEKEEQVKKQKRVIQAELDNIESQIRFSNNKIEESKTKINTINFQITSVKEKIKESKFSLDLKQLQDIQKERLGVHNKEIFLCNHDIKEREQIIERKTDELLKLNQTILLFKKFKVHVASKSLNVIQNKCNRILQGMKSDIRVKLEGYKEKSNGEIKEEITPYIVRDIIRPFGSFSCGERGKVEYAMILTLQYMVNITNKNKGLYFLMIDEAIEGVDPIGMTSILDSLSEFNFPILITTHLPSTKESEDNLKVIKENGVSRIG